MPFTSYATPPALEAKKTQLEDLRETIEKTETEHALTQVQLRRIEHEMVQSQEDILTKAADITRVEQELALQQREVQELFEKEARRNRDLNAYRTQISRMVSAAWSIQYRPQLAAWLLPEETRERALASRALYMTTRSLKEHMDSANRSMMELKELRQTIVDKQQENEVTQQKLRAERKTLQEGTLHQQTLMAKLRQNETVYAKKIDVLTKESQSLEGLIGKLEGARDEHGGKGFANIRPMDKPDVIPSDNLKDNAITQEKDNRPERSKAISFVAAKGSLPLPAEGVISGIFGERRGTNDRLKGLQLQTLRGALVTAPYEGEVLFTGTFLDYGKMVILRHSREYHTLVAGLSRIDVSVGQFLLDGEPIGAMGELSDQRNLYLELRKSSQAINPLPWFAVQKHHYAKR